MIFSQTLFIHKHTRAHACACNFRTTEPLRTRCVRRGRINTRGARMCAKYGVIKKHDAVCSVYTWRRRRRRRAPQPTTPLRAHAADFEADGRPARVCARSLLDAWLSVCVCVCFMLHASQHSFVCVYVYVMVAEMSASTAIVGDCTRNFSTRTMRQHRMMVARPAGVMTRLVRLMRRNSGHYEISGINYTTSNACRMYVDINLL